MLEIDENELGLSNEADGDPLPLDDDDEEEEEFDEEFENLIDQLIETNDLSILQGSSDSENISSFAVGSRSTPTDEDHTIEGSNKRKGRRRRRKPSRKPSQRPAYIPELRILKRDIRRRYPDMIMNVCNTRDFNFVSQFIRTFCPPTALASEEGLSDGLHDAFCRPKGATGMDSFVASLAPCFQLFPDGIIRLENSQIGVRLHEKGSYICGDFELVITQSFELSVPLMTFLATQQQSSSAEDGNNNKDEVAIIPASCLKPLANPIEYKFRGKYYFTLDEENLLAHGRLEHREILQRTLNL